MIYRDQSSAVWANLPNAGLGNKLLVWGNAWCFAHQYQLPLEITGWRNRPGLRSLLKGTGWRRYDGDFRSLHSLWNFFRLRLPSQRIVDEPDMDARLEKGLLYRFSRVPHWSDYFGRLRNFRELLVKALPTFFSR